MTAFIIVCIVLFSLNSVLTAASRMYDAPTKVLSIAMNIGLIIWAVTLL